ARREPSASPPLSGDDHAEARRPSLRREARVLGQGAAYLTGGRRCARTVANVGATESSVVPRYAGAAARVSSFFTLPISSQKMIGSSPSASIAAIRCSTVASSAGNKLFTTRSRFPTTAI